jgi:hypothetical protein
VSVAASSITCADTGSKLIERPNTGVSDAAAVESIWLTVSRTASACDGRISSTSVPSSPVSASPSTSALGRLSTSQCPPVSPRAYRT